MKFVTPRLLQSIATVLASACVLFNVRAQSDGAEMLEGYDISASEIEQLEAGEVLSFSDAEFEHTSRELAADAMVLVDSDIATVLNALEESITLVPTNVLIDYGSIATPEDFSGVRYTAEEIAEAESLLGDAPGERFNLGAADAEILEQIRRSLGDTGQNAKLEAASEAMQAILRRRYNEYQQQGLRGVDSYVRSRRHVVDVGAELQLTTDAFKPFENEFPEFIRVMSAYPQGADCCTHRFLWVKADIRGRPTFALIHTIIQVLDGTVLVTERHYYISSQLNSLQITTAWVPYVDGGYLGLAVSASADVLDSFLGRMLRPLGRNVAKRMVTDVIADIRNDLENRSLEAE